MQTRGDLQPYRPGWQELGNLERRELTIAGVRRAYWLARAQSPASPARQGGLGTAPLLIVLHGSGMTGRAMARFTGLGTPVRHSSPGSRRPAPTGRPGMASRPGRRSPNCRPRPATRPLPGRPGRHRDGQPVTLYRVDDGGHGWPGGPQFLPARFVGTIARHLDATGILLSMAGRETAAATGRRFLDRGEWG